MKNKGIFGKQILFIYIIASLFFSLSGILGIQLRIPFLLYSLISSFSFLLPLPFHHSFPFLTYTFSLAKLLKSHGFEKPSP
jgi:hypothetical protein